MLCLAVLTLSTASAVPPRQDINPALLYLHAFTRFPELSAAEAKWLGPDAVGEVTEEERAVARKFDTAFAHIVRARQCTAPCDWGIDSAEGPEALAPNYIKIRTAANAGWLRARVALADGNQSRVRDELIALSIMNRRSAASSALVGTMIQVAVEGKILDFIAAHFDELSVETRAALSNGLNGPPHRNTVAEAMATEQTVFFEWLLEKVDGFRVKEKSNGGALQQFQNLIYQNFGGDAALAEKIIEGGGGTIEGVVKYIRSGESYYARAVELANASSQDVRQKTTAFARDIETSTNVLVLVIMPNIGKARTKELEFLDRLRRLPNTAP